MTAHLKACATLALLLGGLGLSSMAAATPAHASQPPATAPGAVLRLTVDRPIIHLGETVTLRGSGFTPGATVTFALHGPFSATIGRTYGTAAVGARGTFVEHIALGAYPDALARQFHKVLVAAASSARVAGVQEGAAAAIQVDPIPALDIVTRAPLKATSLTIDGQEVAASITAHDATHATVAYLGHLRAGRHQAYLKWRDTRGGWGARLWSFSTGDPTAVPASPRLAFNTARLRLGESVAVAGTGFTPGATVTISVGGMNARPRPVTMATADATGAFTVRLRIAAYPDANARAAGMIMVSAQATGAAVGDLPEGTAGTLAVQA